MEVSSAITRQELLRLKRRFSEVRSGHRLLEQKRDSLIKSFMELKGEFLERKEKLFYDLKKIIGVFDLSIKANPVSLIDVVASHCQGDIQLSALSQSIMGVKTTTFIVKDFKKPLVNESIAPLSQAYSLKKFSEILPDLIKIASLENALIKLAYAIEKTRRRVNVLRDVTIPLMQKQMKYINLKLADQEREGLIFNLKFKQKRAKTSY